MLLWGSVRGSVDFKVLSGEKGFRFRVRLPSVFFWGGVRFWELQGVEGFGFEA